MLEVAVAVKALIPHQEVVVVQAVVALAVLLVLTVIMQLQILAVAAAQVAFQTALQFQQFKALAVQELLLFVTQEVR
jgi:hypothetical protein